MDTDELIDSLVARHRPVKRAWIERNVAAVVILGLAVSIVTIGLTIGFRHDLEAAALSGRLLAKYAFIVMTMVISAQVFTHLARPGRRLAPRLITFGLPLGFIVIAAGLQLVLMGIPTRSMLFGDQSNWILCMALVPIFAIVPFVGLMLILCRCAPTNLTEASFAAGVFASSIAAMAYASHCPCDTPIFVAIWYSLAFFFSGTIGARVAPFVANW